MRKSKQELITVGITSYNAESTVIDAIQSAINQSWKNLEIIIVDDVSTDNTQNIIYEYVEKIKNIRVFINNENSGVATSRNKIIQEAKGVFVVFFDDDDISLPERITEQYKRICTYEKNFAQRNPVVCYTARMQIYPDETKRYLKTIGETEGKISPNGVAIANRILMGKPLKDGYGACATCSQMARLSVYKNLGGFDNSLRRGEDTDFNLKLALAGGHIVGVSEPLVVQKMTKTEDKNIDEELKNTLLLMDKYKNYIEEHGNYNFCHSWIEMKYAFLKKEFNTFVFILLRLLISNPVRTIERAFIAIPNLNQNFAYSRFYLKSRKGSDA